MTNSLLRMVDDSKTIDGNRKKNGSKFMIVEIALDERRREEKSQI